MKYHLICVSPDGYYVRDSSHSTVKDAWDAANDLGNKWFFYPIPIVVGEKKKRIIDVPEGMPTEWRGKTIKKFCSLLEANPNIAYAYCNGLMPLLIFP